MKITREEKGIGELRRKGLWLGLPGAQRADVDELVDALDDTADGGDEVAVEVGGAVALEDAVFVVDGDGIGNGDGSVGVDLGRQRLQLLQSLLETNLLGLAQR